MWAFLVPKKNFSSRIRILYINISKHIKFEPHSTLLSVGIATTSYTTFITLFSLCICQSFSNFFLPPLLLSIHCHLSTDISLSLTHPRSLSLTVLFFFFSLSFHSFRRHWIWYCCLGHSPLLPRQETVRKEGLLCPLNTSYIQSKSSLKYSK